MTPNDETTPTMHYVGFCRLCETGPLGLRRCGGCGAVVVLCDECDAAWTSADLAAKPLLAGEHDLPCPECGASLFAAPSSWATRGEIEATPWLAAAVAEGALTLRAGKPFTPEGPDPTDDAST